MYSLLRLQRNQHAYDFFLKVGSNLNTVIKCPKYKDYYVLWLRSYSSHETKMVVVTRSVIGVLVREKVDTPTVYIWQNFELSMLART